MPPLSPHLGHPESREVRERAHHPEFRILHRGAAGFGVPSPSLRCSQFVRLRGFSAVGSGLVERSRVREQLWVGVVVRFVCLIRVSLCPCVPCNPSPRCLFTGLRSASPRPLRMPVSASRVSSSSGALAAPPAVTHLPRAPSHFADRLRAGAGRRSGSGWRPGGGRVGFAGGGLF